MFNDVKEKQRHAAKNRLYDYVGIDTWKRNFLDLQNFRKVRFFFFSKAYVCLSVRVSVRPPLSSVNDNVRKKNHIEK